MNIPQINLTPTASAITVRDLTKIFHPEALGRLGRLFRPASANTPVVALNRVNLTIERGEIFGLVGRNGQGKTTLIKSIASLLRPTRGSIAVHGRDTSQDGEAVRGLIGLVSADERTFYGRLTGWQNLMFFARLYGIAGVLARRRILELAEMLDFRPLLSRRFQELSSGNKQRMAFIRALLIDPPLILLDEPTRSLDPIAADELRRVIHQELNLRQGKTIFITSHNLAEVETLCTRVGFLNAGEIKLSATMEELRQLYCTIEQVILDVQGIPEMNGLAHLNPPLLSLKWKTESSGLANISFRRNTGDDALNRVIREIHACGGVILGCRTERNGLREIMNTFEKSDRSQDDAAVADGN